MREEILTLLTRLTGLSARSTLSTKSPRLANQAYNAFSAFPEDALVRIAPDEIRKKGRVPKNGNLFFTIFQTFMSGPGGAPYFGEYPPDFFDSIVIDECHRGGAHSRCCGRSRFAGNHFRGIQRFPEISLQSSGVMPASAATYCAQLRRFCGFEMNNQKIRTVLGKRCFVIFWIS